MNENIFKSKLFSGCAAMINKIRDEKELIERSRNSITVEIIRRRGQDSWKKRWRVEFLELMKSNRWRIIKKFLQKNRAFSIKNFKIPQIPSFPQKTFKLSSINFKLSSFSPIENRLCCALAYKKKLRTIHLFSTAELPVCVNRRWSHAMTLLESKQKIKRSTPGRASEKKKKNAKFFLKIKRQISRKGNSNKKNIIKLDFSQRCWKLRWEESETWVCMCTMSSFYFSCTTFIFFVWMCFFQTGGVP